MWSFFSERADSGDAGAGSGGGHVGPPAPEWRQTRRRTSCSLAAPLADLRFRTALRIREANELSAREILSAGDCLQRILIAARALGAAKMGTSVAPHGEAGIETEMETAIETILAAARQALSHLQYQDVAAQGMMQIDSWIRDAQLVAARMHDEPLGHVPPAMHPELAEADGMLNAPSAGDVLMF